MQRKGLKLRRVDEGEETPITVPSLLSLCKDAVLATELNYNNLSIPEDYKKLLEEHNSERMGRRFRIFTLKEEEKTMSLEKISTLRGIDPLYGHVYLPVDLSPLIAVNLNENEQDEEEKEEDEEKETEEDEKEKEQEKGSEGKGKDKGVTLEFDVAIELLVHVEDSAQPETIRDNPILHGKGALFSQLGIEPDDWKTKHKVEISSKYETFSRNSSQYPFILYAQEKNLSQTLPPPYAETLCYEVSPCDGMTEEEEDYSNTYCGRKRRRMKGNANENAEAEEEKKTERERKGILHAGHHGSEMSFCLKNEDGEDDDDGDDEEDTSLQFTMAATDSDFDDGPEYRVIPPFFGLVAERCYEASSWNRYFKKFKSKQAMKEAVRTLLLKCGMTESQKPLC